MDKAYIVVNEEQEREVLEKLEREGFVWIYDEKPTEWSPVQETNCCHLPYALITNSHVWWLSLSRLTDEEIVFDGRKKSKIKISKKVYDALVEWRRNKILINNYVWYTDIETVPEIVKEWWIDDFVDRLKTNNRLIAIIRWVNGEDVFEVEKPKKWVVRSKETDTGNDHIYLDTFNLFGVETVKTHYEIEKATKFDTKEEAESWANAHQEVIEVKE